MTSPKHSESIWEYIQVALPYAAMLYNGIKNDLKQGKVLSSNAPISRYGWNAIDTFPWEMG